jgi:hypothetical protein
LIVYWTINEGLDSNQRAIPLNPNHESFRLIPEWSKNIKLLFDKVAVIILGSARSWNLGPLWDEWNREGTELLRENGIAVFDFSSQIQNLTEDDGIHLKRNDSAMDAFALYTSSVYDYLTASIPMDHPSFMNRVDVEIDKKWAPFL